MVSDQLHNSALRIFARTACTRGRDADVVSRYRIYHRAIANELSERIEDEGIQLLTTKAILLEIGSASKQAYRDVGRQPLMLC